MRKLLFCLVVSTASLAAAEDAVEDAVEGKVERPWSLGAGLTFGSLGFSNAVLGGLGALGYLQSPGVSTSFERQLGASSSLILGASAQFPLQEDDSSSQLAATLAFRQGLTRSTAIVVPSLLAIVAGSRTRTSFYSAGAELHEATAWVASGGLGFSVERELSEGLALRLLTPLVSVNRRHASFDDVEESVDAWRLTLEMAPSVELRMRF